MLRRPPIGGAVHQFQHKQKQIVQMSKKCPKPLTIHEINNRILAKDVSQRLEHECTGHDGKFRDDSYETYQKKKRQFLETAKQYHNLNKLAMLTNRPKSESDYYDLTFDFMEEDVKEKNTHENGELSRKRNERKIHQQTSSNVEICTTEPWFKRYQVLSRFIQAARKIILKNRLLKNLEKLKTIDEETMLRLETTKKMCDNVSYSELFDRHL